ncbi:MAG: hypothetical protein JKY33_01740 [Bacteroidia bacterium]|nr:hypothetical protein [Bacteroidia bacterium]
MIQHRQVHILYTWCQKDHTKMVFPEKIGSNKKGSAKNSLTILNQLARRE